MGNKSAPVTAGFDLPFAEQLDFFRRKLNLPTEVWDDLLRAGHDRAYVVAGVMQADLLADLRAATEKAIADGTGLETFRKDFRSLVQKHGWTGWTGEGSKAGEAWRTKVIYETNLRTSYAAGRWAQLTAPATLAAMPFWRYVHNDSVLHPRPQHAAWGAAWLTLPHDHPFWRTHFPPNGWGCRCRVTAINAPRPGDATVPPDGWDVIDPATGDPVGIDKGWGYAPGAATTTPLAKLFADKLASLEAPVGAAMAAALAGAVAMEQRLAWTTMIDRVATTLQPNGEAVLARAVSPATVQALATHGIDLETAGVWLRDHDLAHALRDAKDTRGATLPLDVWRELPTYLAGATPYWDTVDPALVYVFDYLNQAGDGPGKLIVRVNRNAKLRADGERQKRVGNFVTTGGVFDEINLANRYKPLND